MKIEFKDSALLRLKKFIETSLKQNDKSLSEIEYILLTPQEILELENNIILLGGDKTPVLRCNLTQGIYAFKVKVVLNESDI